MRGLTLQLQITLLTALLNLCAIHERLVNCQVRWGLGGGEAAVPCCALSAQHGTKGNDLAGTASLQTSFEPCLIPKRYQ
jgi:hypothetical protein